MSQIKFNNSIIEPEDFKRVFDSLVRASVSTGLFNNIKDGEDYIVNMFNKVDNHFYMLKSFRLLERFTRKNLNNKSTSYINNYWRLKNMQNIFSAFNEVTLKHKKRKFVLENAKNHILKTLPQNTITSF